ncbi:MAG: dihydroorotase [Oscillospiraceae bacterium]|jgi:dihydroorotase|nr:dihydroorotase [Oscillospiraceae bacterium]
MQIKVPALVEVHAHFRDPGFTYKEDVNSGSAAAVAGGYGTVVCMANTKPVIDASELLLRRGDELPVRLYQAAAATVGQQGRELTDYAALKAAGAIAISDDGQPILDARVMYDVLQAARDVGLPLMTHSEDGRIPGRGSAAEEYMIARDLLLADTARSPLHIQHVTTAGAVQMIRDAKRSGVSVTCETCPHYFTFTSELRAAKGAIAKVFPPLRTAWDVEAVTEGLADGTIDIIATDHAPHSRDEKALPWDDAPGGMVGLETALAASLTALFHTEILTMPKLLEKFTVNPLKLLNLPLPEDDYVVFDPDEEWTVTESDLRGKSANSPFLGMRLIGRVRQTIVRGKIVYNRA